MMMMKNAGRGAIHLLLMMVYGNHYETPTDYDEDGNLICAYGLRLIESKENEMENVTTIEHQDEIVADAALVPVAQGANYGLQSSSQVVLEVRPAEVIARAQEQAKALMDIVEQQKLYAMIQGKKYLTVEAWQLLAAFNGLSIVIEKTNRVKVEDGEGWEARCVVYNSQGSQVGAGEAQCMNNESKATWRKADDYARRSMAQTRAVSKACRTILSFVVVLAGYEPTPYEEMEGVVKDEKPLNQDEGKITNLQVRTIEDLADENRIKKYLDAKGYKSLKELTYTDARVILQTLKGGN